MQNADQAHLTQHDPETLNYGCWVLHPTTLHRKGMPFFLGVGIPFPHLWQLCKAVMKNIVWITFTMSWSHPLTLNWEGARTPDHLHSQPSDDSLVLPCLSWLLCWNGLRQMCSVSLGVGRCHMGSPGNTSYTRQADKVKGGWAKNGQCFGWIKKLLHQLSRKKNIRKHSRAK